MTPHHQQRAQPAERPASLGTAPSLLEPDRPRPPPSASPRQPSPRSFKRVRTRNFRRNSPTRVAVLMRTCGCEGTGQAATTEVRRTTSMRVAKKALTAWGRQSKQQSHSDSLPITDPQTYPPRDTATLTGGEGAGSEAAQGRSEERPAGKILLPATAIQGARRRRAIRGPAKLWQPRAPVPADGQTFKMLVGVDLDRRRNTDRRNLRAQTGSGRLLDVPITKKLTTI